MIHPDLRPLGIGEILDRTVTLFVRRFAVIFLILALVSVPVAICQYIAQPQTAAMLDNLRQVLTAPPGQAPVTPAELGKLLANNREGQSGVVISILAVLLNALSGTAIVLAVAQAYAGKLPSVRTVYRDALRRWFAQIVAILIFFAFGLVVVIVLALLAFFVGLAIGALAMLTKPVALVIGIAVGVIVCLAIFAVSALLYLAAAMSFVSIALEDPNPIRGVAHGLRRTLSPPIFWRSVRVALVVLIVLLMGELLVLAVATLLAVLTHLTPFYVIIGNIGSIVLSGFVTTFVVIYAFDIRVRREGYDLSLAAQTSTG